MHLKFGYFVVYTPIYRLTERKKRFHVQNCPCGTVGANIGYVLGLLVYDKIVVEFGRKVFVVDCLFWKNIKYGANKNNRTRSSVFMHTKTTSVTIQGNVTAMRYWHDVIRSVLFLHIRANLGIKLARDYASCHVARSIDETKINKDYSHRKWDQQIH